LLITYEIFFLGSTFHVAATILKTVCDHPNRSKLRGIHFKIKMMVTVEDIDWLH